jgi:hypothetical protein
VLAWLITGSDACVWWGLARAWRLDAAIPSVLAESPSVSVGVFDRRAAAETVMISLRP